LAFALPTLKERYEAFDRSQKLFFMGYLTLLQMILRLKKAIKRRARCVVLLVDARAPERMDLSEEEEAIFRWCYL
jgi:hypothetical protein